MQFQEVLAVQPKQLFVQIAVPESKTDLQSAMYVSHPVEWKMDIVRFIKGVLVVPDKGDYPAVSFTKIKCLGDQLFGRARQLKICHKSGEDLFLAVDYNVLEQGLPLQYTWFARLVMARLEISTLAVPPLSQMKPVLPESHTCGLIYRKKLLGKWEAKYAAISLEGLFFSKDSSQMKLEVKATSLKYIWTRFDFYNESLIVKLKHGLQKMEIAIPRTNFMSKDLQNWLLGLYCMMLQRNFKNQQ